MKKLISLINFFIFTSMRSPKIIMPLTVLIFLQLTIYTTIGRRPTDFFSGVFLAEIFTFTIAIWLGFSSNSWVDEVTEQLLILRVKKDTAYYAIYVVFLFLLSICISLISALIPVIFHLADSGFFERYTVAHFLKSFLLITGSSFAGVTLGAMFHPRLMPNKSDTPLIVTIVGLIAITKTSIINWQGFFRYILWTFPNTSAHSSIIVDSSDFTFPLVVRLFLVSILYSICYSLIKIVWLSKTKF